jgi:RecA-family ATPase
MDANEQEQQERALREAERMMILASNYKQMGFLVLAKFMKENSKAAFRWATQQAKVS